MLQILIGGILLSVLHALLPNHWLPLLAIGRKEQWSTKDVTWIAFLSGLAHAFSTILIGAALGILGLKLSTRVADFSRYIAPSVLILLGLYFIYQHHRHHHFHIEQQPNPAMPKAKIIGMLSLTMFFSPCLEIEGLFLVAGTHGLPAILAIAVTYLVLSVSGMVLWVRWAFQKSMHFNWHALEHNAGIITGVTLIVTGVISFFIS